MRQPARNLPSKTPERMRAGIGRAAVSAWGLAAQEKDRGPEAPGRSDSRESNQAVAAISW